ncbi:MAG TPA: response regulator [Terracidiphilus sp.]|jgi:CheY-like chemotaxis protein
MGKPLVLVIDDDQIVADTFAMILNSNGFDAIAAYSGKAGLDAAKKVAFDFLVSDVVMQEMNGIEAANEIRGLLPDCKVVLISGNNDTSVLLKEAESRGQHFQILPKPVHPTALLDALRG